MLYVRAMSNEDFPRVSDLLCSCYRWLGKKEDLTPQNVQFLVEHRGSIDTVKRESEVETYCVACNDTGIVGMVSVKDNEITKLYVHPRWHRKGFGQLLFEKAEEIIAGNGHTTITLGAIGKSPVPFYESMGMVISGRRPCKIEQESGREVVLMEKTIADKGAASRRL